GIDKLESFAVKAVRKVQCGTYQIEEALLVDQDADTLVFKNLVGGLDLIVEVQVVHKPGTATALHRNTDVVVGPATFFPAQFDDSISGFFSNCYHVLSRAKA